MTQVIESEVLNRVSRALYNITMLTKHFPVFLKRLVRHCIFLPDADAMLALLRRIWALCSILRPFFLL
jgi:hypothetical protein